MKTYTIANAAQMLKRGDRGIREMAIENGIGVITNKRGKRLFTADDLERLKTLFAQRDVEIASRVRVGKHKSLVDPSWLPTKEAAAMMTPPIQPATFLRRAREMGIAAAVELERRDRAAYFRLEDVINIRDNYSATIARLRKKKTVGVAVLQPLTANKPAVTPDEERYTVTSLNGVKYLKLKGATKPYDWRASCVYSR